jgi:hypothetical protein
MLRDARSALLSMRLGDRHARAPVPDLIGDDPGIHRDKSGGREPAVFRLTIPGAHNRLAIVNATAVRSLSRLRGRAGVGALSQDSTMIKVTKLKTLGGHRLHATFSDVAASTSSTNHKALATVGKGDVP